MNKIIRLSIINIKNRKSATASLGVLIILSALFFNMGLNIIINMGTFYREKTDTFNTPHNIILFSSKEYKEEFSQYYENSAYMDETETEDVIIMESAEIEVDGDRSSFSVVVGNIDAECNMMKYEFDNSGNIPKKDAIFLPLAMKVSSYEIGDQITVLYKGITYLFKVAGYVEEPVLGTTSYGIQHVFLYDESFQYLKNEVGSDKAIYTRTKNINDSEKLQEEFLKYLRDSNTTAEKTEYVVSFSYEDEFLASTMIANIVFLLLVAFAVIIVIIVMLVTRFRIQNNIEESLINIGALGAMGYTSRQIMGSIIAEYAIISLVSSGLGITLSYLANPLLNKALNIVMALQWSSKLHIGIDLLTILVILALISMIGYFSTLHIKKYQPIVAFHGGIQSIKSRKNWFSLESIIGNINVNLAGKQFIVYMKQNIMVGFIIAGVTFALLFTLVLYYSIGIKTENIYKMLGQEVCDIEIKTTQHTDAEALVEELSLMSEVEDITMNEPIKFTVEDMDITGRISNDFGILHNIETYEGILPMNKNEIVITGILSDKLNKKIGDSVKVEAGSVSAEYIVVGYVQTMDNSGNLAMITEAGYKKLVPSFERTMLSVFLKDDVNTTKFIEKISKIYNYSKGQIMDGETLEDRIKAKAVKLIQDISENYGVSEIEYSLLIDGELISGSSRDNKIVDIADLGKMAASQVLSISATLGALSVVIFICTVIIICLILSLMVKTFLVKRKTEFGIYKALGYTTNQIIMQISLSFMPTVILGAILGTIITCLSLRQILNTALYAIGISKFDVAINPLLLAIVFLFVVGISFCIIVLFARRVKKITVYGLLTE